MRMNFLLIFLLVTLTRTSQQQNADRKLQLKSVLESALDRHLPPQSPPTPLRQQQQQPGGREGRQLQSADPGAIMYLPIGGGGNVRCPTAADAAAVNIAQMTFLATAMNILSIVANINNNLNNNNNNNNQVNINAQSNNNIVSNTNVNNGNQVNVMVPVLNP